MRIAYAHNINFNHRQSVLRRIAGTKNRERYLELFQYLVKNNINYTITSNGVLFNTTSISQHTAYELDGIITKYKNYIRRLGG